MSATEHRQAARAHDRAAEQHEAAALSREQQDPNADTRCFDQPLEGVAESGGERYELLRPCWTALTSPSARERREAMRHREIAAAHRARARALQEAERDHCAGLGADERSHSPFYHRSDILRVEPYREGGALRGARVLFRRVPGLTVAWMRKALACHMARAAALGYPTDFMPYCPAVLPSVAVEVVDTGDAIAVVVRSERDDIAAAVLGRAQDLVRDR